VVNGLGVMSSATQPTAVLFPGQGSQRPGMRAQAEAIRPDLVELADEECGGDPFERADESTRFQQPAIYCASLAAWERLVREQPVALAGHSLGEITALAAAGALGHADGLRVVAERARLMQAAADASEAGMIAVKGPRARIEPLVHDAGVTLANDNSPRQVVLAGPRSALADAARHLGDEGIRSTALPVAGAFHSSQMEPAVEGFRRILDEVEVRPPRVDVISCVTARPFTDVRDELARALTSPVRWVEVVEGLHSRGVERFVETGPGAVLTGLVRRIVPGAESQSIDAPEAARA
jgi:[acyl-carrier-protein] S-malonyltransferase